MARPYTSEEDSFIIANCKQNMSYGQVAEQLGSRTAASVASRFFKLRSAGRIDASVADINRFNGWTEEQDETLWKEFGLVSDEELRRKVGPTPTKPRTLVALRLRAYYIGATKGYNRNNVHAV